MEKTSLINVSSTEQHKNDEILTPFNIQPDQIQKANLDEPVLENPNKHVNIDYKSSIHFLYLTR